MSAEAAGPAEADREGAGMAAAEALAEGAGVGSGALWEQDTVSITVPTRVAILGGARRIGEPVSKPRT